MFVADCAGCARYDDACNNVGFKKLFVKKDTQIDIIMAAAFLPTVILGVFAGILTVDVL